MKTKIPEAKLQLPVTSYQLPVTSYQLPVSGYLKSVIKLLILFLLNNSSVIGQYSMSIEFEEPDPALEFSLTEAFPESNFNVFSFGADSLFQHLLNSGDSTLLTLNLDGDSTLTLVLDDYSIYSNYFEDSLSFSKKGKVQGYPNSSVVGHFSDDYFWLHILIDSTQIRIDPIRSFGENYSDRKNLFLIVFESGEWNADETNDDDCSTYYIELGVFVDPEAIAEFENDIVFLGKNIDAQILRLEKFYNDEIGDFNIKFKVLKTRFLSNDDTKGWNYNERPELKEDVNGKWNFEYCIKPDLYILFSGRNLGGGHAVQGNCNTSQEGSPGLAFVPTVHSFGSTPGEVTYLTVTLAHEVSHVIGASEGELVCDCDDNPSCTPANLMCQYQCSSSPSAKFNLLQCSINQIGNYLEARCETCFSEFSTAECVHCNYTGAINTDDAYPLVTMCDERNDLTLTFTFVNDCVGKNVYMRATYPGNVLKRESELNGFTSEQTVDNQKILVGPTVYLTPEATLSYTLEFRLYDDAPANFHLNNLDISFVILSGGNQIFTRTRYPFFITFLAPEIITGTVDLSDLLEPDTDFLFDADNLSGCTVSNPPLRLNGTLNIDEDYCLHNTMIIMESNAKIVVKDGNTLTINKDMIMSCDTMWDAIEVEEGASLVINESNIEDAMAAVRLEENTRFASSETKYHNNLYGVIAALNEPGDIEFNILAGNSFTADDILRKDPVSGHRAKAGIWLANVNEAYIQGEPPHIEPGMNIFSNLKNGIVLYNTDASIQNFHIYDIHDGPANIKEVDELPDGHGIYVYGSSDHFTTAIGSADTRDNYIHAQRGIFVKDANADIQYCNIRADLSAIILGYSNNREVNILNNLLNAQYRGINLRLPISLEAIISGNRITMPTDNGIGIQCLSSWESVKITDNHIFLNSSPTGIGLTDCKSTYMEDNRIIFENIGEHQMRGITLEACSGNIIVDNHIIGKNKDHNTVGIYTQDSPANTVLCNGVKMANVCYQFAGVSSLTNFHSNNHLSSDFGLLLGSEAIGSDAIIGDQVHKQNKWAVLNYGQAGAWTLTEDPEIIARSNFVVDDSQNPYYPPNILDLLDINWFENVAVNEYEFDCQNLPILLPDLPDLCCNFSVPGDTIIGFDTYPEVKDLRLKKQLYQSLKDGLIDTSETVSLYEFYAKSDTASYGKLVDVRQLFELASISSAGSKSSSISAAIAKNNQIPDADGYLLYETEANERLAEYLEDGDLEGLINAEEGISDAAKLCPYEFGDGVYMNRSFLRAIDLESKFDEVDACGAIEPRSSKEEDVSELDMAMNQIQIWPNPAHIKELISILSSQTISRIMVTDIIGRKILEYQPTSKAELSFHFLIEQSGWYVITVWNEVGKRTSFHQIIVD